MAAHNALGRAGEAEAVRYLQQQGYTLRMLNYRHGRAEVDLIVERNGLLVFVEVKTRTNVRFGEPEAFVSAAQAARVMQAAEAYLLDQNWQHEVRFDVVAVVQQGGGFRVQHFEDAFG